MQKKDVVIIGAGVAGLCSAYHLSKAGRSVAIVDQQQPGAGSSHGNCGLISPSHVLPNTLPGLPWKAFKWMFQKAAPFKVMPQPNLDFMSWMFNFWKNCSLEQVKIAAPGIARILASSRTLFHELIEREQMAVDYQQNGCIYVYSTDQAYQAEAAWHPIYQECGVSVQTFDGPQLAAFEPSLKPEVLRGGYFFPNDASLRPDLYVSELVRVVQNLGVEIRSNVTVLGLQEDAIGVSVQTNVGPMQADQVILAAGSWSPLISKSLGFRLPIQPGKGYSLTMPRPSNCPKHPMVLKEKSVAVTPWPSGFRLGSTMEFVGYDTSLNPARLQALVDGASYFLQTPTAEGAREEWFGWRPMTTDTLPIIDRAPNFKRLWLATGHSMLGVSMSTGTGKLISELLLGQQAHIDPTPYRYSRF